jgi:lysophospholipase L1-like esterase
MSSTFRTILSVTKANFDISHQNHILTMGSCFAENIAQYLQKGRFHLEINPFGILYNPISIAKGLGLLYNDTLFPESELVQQGELWHSFLHHGSFAKLSKTELLTDLNMRLEQHRAVAQKTNRIILTLGTANVFVYRDTGNVVANCHKMPNTAFDKRRLSVAECVAAFEAVFQKIKTQHPDIQIIVTVSPVRHIRDGIIENQRSKATLLLTAEQLAQKFPFVEYFPAYEILMDDLRDYRFYNEDMIHPSDAAVAYVWEAFQNSFFSESTKNILSEVDALNRLLAHRPLFPETNEYQLFLRKQIEKSEALQAKYPFLKKSF